MPPPSPMPPAPVTFGVRRVVLVGYMCAGKSAVGAALARRLEWDFLDFDVEIERREGRSVARIVEMEGEGYFRAAEAALTGEVRGMDRLVLAPGGGWITQPGLLESIRPDTLAVWLAVSAEETVRRLRADSIARPFRDHPDPAPLVAQMLAEREPLYRLADLRLQTDGATIEDTAFEIERLVRAGSH